MKNVFGLILFTALISACGVQSRLKPQTSASQGPTTVVPQKETAEESAETSFESCRTLSDLESQLLAASGVSVQDKGRILDTLLVTLRGTRCAQLVLDLSALFKESPLLSLITSRVDQMQKPSAENLLQIWSQNNAMIFDGADVFATATDLEASEAADPILLKATLKYDGRSARVSTVLAKSAIKDIQKPTTEEAIEAARGQAIYFDGQEFKYLNATTQSKATQLLTDIKKRYPVLESKEPAKEGTATAAPAPVPAVTNKKYTFDLTDKDRLSLCGAEAASNKILEQLKLAQATVFDDLLVTKLEVGATDPDSIQNKTNIIKNSKVSDEELWNQKMYEYALQNQNVPKQGFWVLSQDGKLGRQYSFVTHLKSTDYANNPIIMYELYERPYDFSNSSQIEKVTDMGAFNYNIKTMSQWTRKFRIRFDASSAYWLSVRSENVAKCMEQNKYAAIGASRDSVKSYIIFSLFDKANIAQKLSSLP